MEGFDVSCYKLTDVAMKINSWQNSTFKTHNKIDSPESKTYRILYTTLNQKENAHFPFTSVRLCVPFECRLILMLENFPQLFTSTSRTLNIKHVPRQHKIIQYLYLQCIYNCNNRHHCHHFVFHCLAKIIVIIITKTVAYVMGDLYTVHI